MTWQFHIRDQTFEWIEYVIEVMNLWSSSTGIPEVLESVKTIKDLKRLCQYMSKIELQQKVIDDYYKFLIFWRESKDLKRSMKFVKRIDIETKLAINYMTQIQARVTRKSKVLIWFESKCFEIESL